MVLLLLTHQLNISWRHLQYLENVWNIQKGWTDADDVDNPDLEIDHENGPWFKNEVADMLQVGDIAVIKSYNPVHFFIYYVLEQFIPWIRKFVTILGMFTTQPRK